MVGDLNEAVVYSGNVIIDTAGFDVSVSQALLAPSATECKAYRSRMAARAIYGPPIVQIDPSGSGSGATAVAQINPVAGTLTQHRGNLPPVMATVLPRP